MANKDNELPIVVSVDTSDVTVKFAEITDDAPSLIEMEAVLNVDDSALDIVNDIPDETNTDVNITESEDAKQAVAGIHFMALKDKIETVWNIIGTGVGILTDIGGKLINPFLDVEDAVAKINAQTGNGTGIADLGQLIRDIQAADLGDSVDQISDVMIAAQHLNQPLEEAATAALTFTHTFKEEDPTTVLNTLDALVKQHLVPDLQSAADLMTVFFQAGGNKSGDALQTVDKYATAWSDMGLDISEAMSFVTSLMAGGVDTSEAASKMLLDFDNAMTVATDPTSAQAKFLAAHGLDNPKEMGEAIGAETINGFVTAFQTMSVEDQDMASKMFFGKGGALNTGAIAGATSEDPRFKEVTDAAKRAATEIDNSLRGAIDDFVLAVNTEIAKLLSSDEIDLPGKIAALKEGFQEAVDVLSKGGTVGEAIEVGLNMPGFNEAVLRFASSIGKFEISILKLIAGIQDMTGKDSTGTRAEIARLGAQQLSFDLKVANPDEIGGEIQAALDNGVDASKISDLANVAGQELIAQGDLDRAQALADNLERASAAVDVYGFGRNIQKTFTQGADESLTDFQTRLNEAKATAESEGFGFNIHLLPTVETSDLQAAIDQAKKDLAQSKLDFGPDLPQGSPLGAFGAEQGAKTSPFLTGLDTLKTKADEAKTKVADATTNIATSLDTMATDAGTAVDTTVAHFNTAAVEADLMDQGITLSLTGNTVTTSFTAVQTAAETSFPIVIEWFGRTAQGAVELDNVVTSAVGHMSKLLHDLQFLSAQVAQGVADAVAAGANLPSVVSGGGASGDTNINVNQTNNNSNGAQTAATTYQIAAAVGGSA